MKPTEIHETIAAQIDNMKPADLRPGIDVAMAALRENTLLVRVFPNEPNDERSRDVQITYEPGPDLYSVVVFRHGERTEHSDVYCDQLGELVFGSDAKSWSLPFGQLTDLDTGEVISEW